MTRPPLTCLQAPAPPSWLGTSCRGLSKYLRSIRLHQPTKKLRWAVSPGRGLQVMSCSSPASHLSSSFSLSVSSSISSSWTLALMAVSSWGDKGEVRLALSQARVVQTPPRLYSLCQMVKNKIKSLFQVIQKDCGDQQCMSARECCLKVKSCSNKT